MAKCNSCNDTGLVPHIKRAGVMLSCDHCDIARKASMAALRAVNGQSYEATADDVAHRTEREPARPWWQSTRYGVGE